MKDSSLKTPVEDRITAPIKPHRAGSDVPFFLVTGTLGGSYVLLILAMLAADILFTSPAHFAAAFAKPEIQHAIWLTLITCSISALLSIWVTCSHAFTFAGDGWSIWSLIFRSCCRRW
jgi:ABC-type sulfate transport system permease component